MATTTNYGWTTPDNTDAVANGALAIRTLGSAVDTSLFAVANQGKIPNRTGFVRNGSPSGVIGPANFAEQNDIFFAPIEFGSNVTLASVSVNVTNTASATSYLGVYTSDPTTKLPANLVTSFGTFSGSSLGIKTVSTTQALTAGLYWFAIQFGTDSYEVTAATANPALSNLYPITTAALSFTATSFGCLVSDRGTSGLPSTAGTTTFSERNAPLFAVSVTA